MKTYLTLTAFVLAGFMTTISSCKKDVPHNDDIQQGDITIEIFALRPASDRPSILIKYNNVIDDPISGVITVQSLGGETEDIPFEIPAGYQKLESWGEDNFLNVFSYYTGFVDYAAVEITKVSCPNKTYGFKVLKASDSWTYYHPTDPITSVNFISNNDHISYSDYAFNASYSAYDSSRRHYSFNFFQWRVFLVSDSTADYPLREGLVLDIPWLQYFWNNHNYGSQGDYEDSASNGSTLKLTVTKVTDKYFDATLDGKIWSSLQPDTLMISEGVIKDALLPVKD